jgi:photosystem II stability/assembly factor-like uncharacterized protein
MRPGPLRLLVAIAGAGACALSALPGTAQAATAPASTAYGWKNAQIVGGGFVTGVVFNPTQPGLAYARTDIGGAYRWDALRQRWIPLMDSTGLNDWNHLGVESIATSPRHPNRVWAAVGEYTQSWAGNGAILRSDDYGRTWTKTDLPIQLGSNEDGRGAGERLAVDPANDQVLYLGTRHNGLWRSTDGGASWAQVADFPVTSTPNDTGLSFVTFARKAIYVGHATDSGANLYRSTDGGATWSAVPGAPTGLMPQHLEQDAAGTVYVSYADQPGPNGMTNGAVYAYRPASGSRTSGSWTDITPEKPGVGGNPSFGYAGLAVDPRHPGTVLVATNDRWNPIDDIYRTTDGGKTWTSVSATASLDVSASPYLKWGGTPKFGWWISTIAIDPFDPAHVVYGTGATLYGSWDATAASTHWSSAAAEGIEETAVNDLLSPTVGSGHLISALGDVGGFYHDTLTASPAEGMSSPIESTETSLSEAGQAPLDVIRVGWSAGYFSADGGKTWTAMTNPAGATDGAGTAAISAGGTAIVWVPEDNSWAPQTTTPVHSSDHGKTWSAAAGLPDGSSVIADPVKDGVFYGYDPAKGAVYTSTDGGATFTETASGLATGGQLKAAPGRSGDLWFSAQTGGLLHSTDGGTTFTPVTSASASYTLGFGKAAPGGSYPALYQVGTVGGVTGVFRSDDAGASWVRINDDQHQYAWTGTVITGDPRVYGRVYLGTNGRGILYADPAER